MINSRAGTPQMACVQAQPRELSNSICASSITATSTASRVSAISMVLLIERAALSRFFPS